MHAIPVCRDQLTSLLKQGLKICEIADRLNIGYTTVRKRMAAWGLKGNRVKSHTPEVRAKMSAAKRKWNRENPERLREIMSQRNKSAPCEKLKGWLSDQGIVFVEEYQPLRHKDRYFSIDIAFPDKRIGIEVNGNQHYGPNGRLTEYCQQRHDLIEAEGWTLYELHYSACFNEALLGNLVPSILGASEKVTFDYQAYIQRSKQPKPPRPSDIDPGWRSRPRPNDRVYERPSKETLQQLVWQKPVTEIAKEIGCGSTLVKQWCKLEKIPTPPRGYWNQIAIGKTREEALAPKPPKTPKRLVTPEVVTQIVELKNQHMKWTAIGHALGFGRHAVYRAYVKWRDTSDSNRD